MRWQDKESKQKNCSPDSPESLFLQNCIKKRTISCLTLLKKRDNMPTVAISRNNYVTICNKNEQNGHNNVTETCQ